MNSTRTVNQPNLIRVQVVQRYQIGVEDFEALSWKLWWLAASEKLLYLVLDVVKDEALREVRVEVLLNVDTGSYGDCARRNFRPTR